MVSTFITAPRTSYLLFTWQFSFLNASVVCSNKFNICHRKPMKNKFSLIQQSKQKLLELQCISEFSPGWILIRVRRGKGEMWWALLSLLWLLPEGDKFLHGLTFARATFNVTLSGFAFTIGKCWEEKELYSFHSHFHDNWSGDMRRLCKIVLWEQKL